MTTDSRYVLTPAFFEEKYRQLSDPWDFSGSEYELSRYQSIIAALAHKRYTRAFEPGCSIGVLTELLASICGFVEAIDFSQSAVSRAQKRCARLKNVDVTCATLPDRRLVNRFDLVVLSEIGYYFTEEEWMGLSSVMVESMPKGGTLLAAHWLGHSTDHCLNGDQVHEVLLSLPNIQLDRSERYERFRLDRWVRV